ncbi:hypothetical protein quinque_007474 [Culex quinquefasciatus]
MLYVIDQRLKAQAIPLDKSAQVLREITEVLLDPKFLHYISTAYQHNMLTVQQTRILLTDIACCSLMRLDVSSMDKLWDLMVMIFKWQMYLTNKSAQALMDLTFRHLDGIGRLIPEMRKQILIDNVKKSLIEINSHEIDTLVEQLNIQHSETDDSDANATNVRNSESIHGGLNDIVIDQNVEPEAKTSSTDELNAEGGSNLAKFMKKIKMDDDELVVKHVEATNPNEELLKMFDQNLDLNEN